MSFNSVGNIPEQYEYNYESPEAAVYGHPYVTDGPNICNGDEASFWSASPRSDSSSPNVLGRNPYHQPYHSLPFLQSDVRHSHCRTDVQLPGVHHTPFVRVVKRRTTANKKERRRTLSINNAYADLREMIPNVPHDTKLSKIKTLRLATSYISYLTGVLETDEPGMGFKAELLTNASRRNSLGVNQAADCTSVNPAPSENDNHQDGNGGRRSKGRTGWPQHVWALELKQEQTL